MVHLPSLTNLQKGSFYLVAGTLIFLDSISALSSTIHYVILFGALGMIFYGLILTDLVNKTSAMINRQHHSK